MYSLDQVIYFLDQRQQTEDWNIRDAAIAYLKGYREILPEYGQMKLDAVNNPLTLDELKAMTGKPVWVHEYDQIDDTKGWHRCRWYLVEYVNGDCCYVYDSDGEKDYFCISDYGKTWTAYRKERK